MSDLRRQIAAVAAGNGLEFYDFVTYAYFARQIGFAFFPSDRPSVSLLGSLAAFGAGFLTRPLGALILGPMGDRIGRRRTMLLTFLLVGLATIGLAVMPSYASIGITAPMGVIFLRLLQGFALGGEVGPSTAFVFEVAPPARRGLFVSFQVMSADGAVVVAGLIGMALAALLTPHELSHWGWRIAFLLGATGIPIVYIARRTLVESLAPPAPNPVQARIPWSIVLPAFVMLTGITVCNYVLAYLATYASTILGIDQSGAFEAVLLTGVAGLAADPIGGWLSDRWGRKPIMIAPTAILALTAIPAFAFTVHLHSGSALHLMAFGLATLADLSTAAILVSLVEGVPRAMRSGAVAIIYALAISVFGGSTQFVIAWLIEATRNPLAPALYMTAATLAGLAAMIIMPETHAARDRLR